jgi:glycosyltransferase involved in cell wall biosynthesis
MNIAVYTSNRGMKDGKPIPTGGTGLYRQYLPHEKLAEWGHNILFTDSVSAKDYDGYEIVVVSKAYFAESMHLFELLRMKGHIVIIDYDDYWVLPSSHYLELAYKQQGTTKFLAESLRKFDYVTCTTPLLQDKIRQINPNVEVFENAIDPDNKQFERKPTQSKNVRFGWIGGHCHMADIALLDGTPQKLKGDFEMILFGHDGQKESIYNGFGYILSGRLSLVKNNRFFIHKAKDARSYTSFYNQIDVALAPLVNDSFNSFKSELKMVEAGFFKKACVASDVWPYRYIINDSNCLSVSHKTHWAKQMQKLINSEQLRIDLGESLYESVKDKYNLNVVAKRREQWYESIL